uniref:Uncharacterized protein n=1 Tax=uncultured bacterium F41-01 TaxID=1191437 RepID=I3VIN8_9BACT|nr:hypothetical protein [uncultured bacterium F41-01]
MQERKPYFGKMISNKSARNMPSALRLRYVQAERSRLNRE